MIDIQTGPIYTIENTTRNEYIEYISIFNSNYRIGFKIPMPTSRNIFPFSTGRKDIHVCHGVISPVNK